MVRKFSFPDFSPCCYAFGMLLWKPSMDTEDSDDTIILKSGIGPQQTNPHRWQILQNLRVSFLCHRFSFLSLQNLCTLHKTLSAKSLLHTTHSRYQHATLHLQGSSTPSTSTVARPSLHKLLFAESLGLNSIPTQASLLPASCTPAISTRLKKRAPLLLCCFSRVTLTAPAISTSWPTTSPHPPTRLLAPRKASCPV